MATAAQDSLAPGLAPKMFSRSQISCELDTYFGNVRHPHERKPPKSSRVEKSGSQVEASIARMPPIRLKHRLRQCDALEGADDVVRAFGGEETFVVAGAEIPVGAFVIFVAIKPPDAADHDDAAYPIVPKIADVMEAQVRPRVSAFEADVIVKDELRQSNGLLGRFDVHFAGAARMVSKRAEFPFHVDDTAIIRRQFSFRYLSHKRRRFDVDLEPGIAPCRED